jgi:uncharacterized protein YjlB
MRLRRATAVGAWIVLGLGFSSRGQDLPPAFPREGATQVLDNAWGTAWDVTWAPNMPTAMHRHAYDYVGVELVDSTFNLTAPSGQPRTSSLKKGDCYFLPKGITHIEEGLSSNPPRHAILIDLKDSRPPSPDNTTGYPTAFPRDAAKKIVDNQRVTMWDYTWTPGQTAPTYFYEKAAFTIFVDDGQLNLTGPDGKSEVRVFNAGQILFTPGGTARSEEAMKNAVHAIIIELK